MADPTATFAVELKDETSGPAAKAASSLENLKTKIDGDVKALREMQKAMRLLKGGTSTSQKAFAELRDKIDAQKAAVATAQSSYVELGGTFGKTQSILAKTTGKFGSMSDSVAASTAPMQALSSGVSKFGAMLANPIALTVAFGVALTALAAAAGVALGAMLKFAASRAGARRDEALQLEGLNTLRQRYGMMTASVQDLQAAIDRASDSTNQSRSTLAGYARSLARAGLKGDALRDAVEAMGIAAQVQGERGANRFRALAFNARLAGGSVVKLAEAYKRRLGPIARRQMLNLDNQAARFQRRIDRLFDAVNIEPFLKALDGVLSMFSLSTKEGQALKTIINGLLSPFFDIKGLGPLVRTFFQGMIIMALKFTLIVLDVRDALIDTFGGIEFLKGVDKFKLATQAGMAVLGAMVVVVGGLALAFGALAVVIGLAVAAMLVLPALSIAAIVAIGTAIGKVAGFIHEFDFKALGTSIIDGLVAGLIRGVSRVEDAVKYLAKEATQAFTSALGIASPSKVFTGYGENISAGVVRGVDAGSADVNNAVGGLVDVPEGGASIRSTASVSIGDVIVHAGGTSDPAELASALRDELAGIFEGVSIEMGAA